MTRRSSVRAQARRIYCEQAQASQTKAPTADPPSPGGFGGQGLTERARALYEDSAVPVREIARLAGVTERTIYKYAAKHAWKPRYRWAPDRGWRAEAAFAPAKGAGARFIARSDKGRPFARGLKALDPAGRARALRASDKAARLARAAQAEAEAERATDALVCAFESMNQVMRQHRQHRAAPRPPGAAWRARLHERLGHALCTSLEFAVARCECAATAWQQAEQRARAEQSGAGTTPSPFQGEVEEERGAIGTS